MTTSTPPDSPVACDPFHPELCALVDGELGSAAAQAVEAHLARCPACAQAVAQLRMLRGRTWRIAGKEGALPAPRELRERIERELDAAAATRSRP